jgi:hypothetical protein
VKQPVDGPGAYLFELAGDDIGHGIFRLKPDNIQVRPEEGGRTVYRRAN